MARRVLIVLLSVGAITGFVGGFVQLHHFRHHGFGPGELGRGEHGWAPGAYEEHVADVCARAAERVMRERPERRDPPPPPPPAQ